MSIRRCLLSLGLLGCGHAVAPNHASSGAWDEKKYPRYAWAVDEQCWGVALQYRREVFEHGRQMNTHYDGPDPEIHERKMRGEYEGCVAQRQQQADNATACADIRRTLVAYEQDRAGCPQQASEAQDRWEVATGASPRIDPGRLSACLNAAASPTAEKFQALMSQQQPGLCQDEAARFNDLRHKDDADIKAARAEVQRRAREAAADSARRRSDAIAKAHADPRFVVATHAKELCDSFVTLTDILRAKDRVQRIDAASGTVSLRDRREVAAAEIEFRDRIEAAEDALVKSGGTLPPSEKHSASVADADLLRAHWCSQPQPHSIEEEYIAGASAP